MRKIIFPHPEPPRLKARIRPLFLPFSGCPHRCVFCSQTAQTGEGINPLETIYAKFKDNLEQDLKRKARPYEIAFFGGTFTALPGDWSERFVDLAASYRNEGLTTRIRCSTRPDALWPEKLDRLKSLGLNMVELGVQSFDPAALAESGRGYDPRTAIKGCRMVLKSGLTLGVQLMPGMPGSTPKSFLRDADLTSGLGPRIVRLYPCLALKGTRLAEIWSKGGFTPWGMEKTLLYLSMAVGVFWRKGIRTARIGLAPERAMIEDILAGPWSPDLGTRVRARALFGRIKLLASGVGREPEKLMVPRRYSGEIFGRKKELAPSYERMGLGPGRIKFWDNPVFMMR